MHVNRERATNCPSLSLVAFHFFPLELIFSNVWGPALTSTNGNKYYVSFIDDFNKFTWVYLIKAKLDVVFAFLRFQIHVEPLLGKRILSFQSDRGGEYEALHKILQDTGIKHQASCPHIHQ